MVEGRRRSVWSWEECAWVVWGERWKGGEGSGVVCGGVFAGLERE